ncbi:MAG TPA: hypothetical protein VMU69_27865 [Bradyrhizobium sp.]|nr:hypothetical protein [Bradyrhizobium sp.]
MSRISVSSLILLLLLPAIAFAAPAHKRHHIPRWNYGFLPGYHQPPSNTIPILGPVGTVRRNGPSYVPSYWYNGDRYYFGEPGFFRGRYNGGSFGPCYTYTPIGFVWNCG